jgi:hypothetical protein
MASPVRSFISVLGSKLATSNYTDGADSKHDEVNVLGEQFLPTYIVHPNNNISTATAASHILQIMAGSSLKVRIRRIELYQVVMATTVTGADFQVFRLSSAGTGGTAYTPAALDTADTAAGATAMTLPTVKGTETTLVANIPTYLMQTLGASNATPALLGVLDFDRPRSKPLIIQSGTANGIAVKIGGGVAGASVMIQVWLDESSY